MATLGENFVLEDPELAQGIYAEMRDKFGKELQRRGQTRSLVDQIPDVVLRAIYEAQFRGNLHDFFFKGIQDHYRIRARLSNPDREIEL